MPNYLRSDALAREAPAKPMRGQRVLDKAAQDAERHRIERRAKAEVRKRDGRCRWPEDHVCRGGLEAAHMLDLSLGGDYDPAGMVLLCAWIHRRGPESIHGKQLKIEAETEADAFGPLSFWRRTGPGEYVMVRRELAPFVYERD